MSHFVVVPIRPEGGVDLDGGTIINNKLARDCLKKYYTEERHADEAAKTLAKKNPQIQFAVLKPCRIFETLPPAEPKLIEKRITDTGEIVLNKGD